MLFSLEVVFCCIARGAADLFPYLRLPCKARQVCIGVCGAHARAYPAIDAVDKGCQCNLVAAAECVTKGMQFARIDAWQASQQCRGLVVKLDGVAAEQCQRPRDASLRRLGGLDQRSVV